MKMTLVRYVLFSFSMKLVKVAEHNGSKVQLISKCLFWCLQFPPKNEQKKVDLIWGIIVVKSNFFVQFLGELKIPKRHFEINRPFHGQFYGQFCFYYLKRVTLFSIYHAFWKPFAFLKENWRKIWTDDTEIHCAKFV